MVEQLNVNLFYLVMGPWGSAVVFSVGHVLSDVLIVK